MLFEAFLDRADPLSPEVARIELMLQTGNPAVQRLHANLGFVEEGILRDRAVGVDGMPIDDVMMARLR